MLICLPGFPSDMGPQVKVMSKEPWYFISQLGSRQVHATFAVHKEVMDLQLIEQEMQYRCHNC